MTIEQNLERIVQLLEEGVGYLKNLEVTKTEDTTTVEKPKAKSKAKATKKIVEEPAQLDLPLAQEDTTITEAEVIEAVVVADEVLKAPEVTTDSVKAAALKAATTIGGILGDLNVGRKIVKDVIKEVGKVDKIDDADKEVLAELTTALINKISEYEM